MATQFAVDLVFKSQTQQLDAVVNKIQRFERELARLKGGNPFAGTERGARDATRQVNALDGAVRGLKGGFAGLAVGGLAVLGIGAALIGLSKAAIDSAGNISQLNASLKALGGSQAVADQLRDSLFKLSKTTPFRNEEILETARRFLAVGVPVKALEGTLNRVGAIAAQSGQDLGRLGLIYAQIYAKGRLQAEENMQLLEAGVNVNKELAQVTGLSGAALQKAMSDGKIGIDAFNKALTIATGDMDVLDAAAKSVSVQMANVGDNVQQVAGAFSVALAPAFAAVFGIINQAFDKLFPNLQAVQAAFKPLLVQSEKFAQLLGKNPKLVEAIAASIESLIKTAIDPMVGGIRDFNEEMEKRPQGLVDTVLDIELAIRRTVLGFRALGQLNDALKGAINPFANALGGGQDFKNSLGLFQQAASTFQEMTGQQRLKPRTFGSDPTQGAARAGNLDSSSLSVGGRAGGAADQAEKARERELGIQSELRQLAIQQIELNGKMAGIGKDRISQLRAQAAVMEEIVKLRIADVRAGQDDPRIKSAKAVDLAAAYKNDLLSINKELDDIDFEIKDIIMDAGKMGQALLGSQLDLTESPLTTGIRQVKADLLAADQSAEALLVRLNKLGGTNPETATARAEIGTVRGNIANPDPVKVASQKLVGGDITQLEEQQRQLTAQLKLGGREMTTLDQLIIKYGEDWKALDPTVKQHVTTLATGSQVLQDQIKAAETQRQLWASVGQTIKDGMVNGIQAAIEGTETLQGALSGILKQLGGMFLNAAFSGIGKEMKLPGFAGGGSPEVGKASIIGERGPELFIPGQQGTVIPNDIFAATREALGGSGSTPEVAFAENGDALTSATRIQKERMLERQLMSTASGSATINVQTQVINGVEYATVAQLNETAQASARKARAQVFSDLKNRPSVRSQVGMR